MSLQKKLFRGALAGAVAWALCASLAAAEQPKVLILLAEGYNHTEHFQSCYPLKALGYQVDIASPAKGIVGRKSTRPGKEWAYATANLTLDEVKVDEYVGLVIPGGGSPARLEKHPRSFEICRLFMESEKLVAGICHGPRLLLRAGLLKGRTMTCLHGVANELPDDWKARRYGRYLDQAVVVDGNLITSRTPGDQVAFIRTFARMAAERGGITLPTKRPNVLLVQTHFRDPHRKWALWDAPGIWGAKVTLIDSSKGLEQQQKSASYDPKQYDAIITVPGAGVESVTGSDAFKALVADSGLKPKNMDNLGDAPAYEEWFAPILKTALEAAREKNAVAAAERNDTGNTEMLAPLAALVSDAIGGKRQVAVALRAGFDDDVVKTATDAFSKAGCPVTFIGHTRGAMVGMNGLEINVKDTYGQAELSKNAVVILPGGVFPEKTKVGYGADEQPAWLDEQDKRDQTRLGWLMAKWKDGVTLVSFGFDSRRLAMREEFRGKQFASSGQFVWGFGGKVPGKRSRDPVVATAERLVSVQSSEELKKALAQRSR